MPKTADEVTVKQVHIKDDFWSEIQNCIINVVIPFQEHVLNDEVEGVAKSHAIENFRIAAGLSTGEFYGMVFQDSDVAKWLEGVAYSLTVKPDAALEKRADDIIDIIEKAQQPDGYLNTYFTIKEPEHRWQDLQECHELYNGTISGIQLDGKRYFYVNPLEVQPGISGKVFGYRHVLPERPGWYECACCPTNLVRLMTSLSAYAWSEGKDTIYSHLFMGQEADLEKAKIQVESRYPWEGKVVYHVSPKQSDFTLAIHIPGYIKIKEHHLQVTINGEPVCIEDAIRKGYLYINQIWREGDTIEITFDMPVREVYANNKVRDDEGCVALMRGPIVYCFEGVDNDGDVQSLRIPENVKAEAVLCKEGKLSGNMLLKVDGYRIHTSDALYSEERPTKEKETLTAIPYYAWANRGENQMRVWMHELS